MIQFPTNNNIIIIAGPTASGKSQLALNLAMKYNGIIINADSQQVYKHAPILTAQPNSQELSLIPHKLYGYIDEKQQNNVVAWTKQVKSVVIQAEQNNQMPIIVGGTGFYLRAIIDGISQIINVPQEIRTEIQQNIEQKGNLFYHNYLKKVDPLSAQKINSNDTQRLSRALEILKYSNKTLSQWQQENPPKSILNNHNFISIKLLPHKQELYKSCNSRFLNMIQNNVINEVIIIKNMNLNKNHPLMKIIGVEPIIQYINQHITKQQAIEKSQQLTRNYAKRQISWFKNQLVNALTIPQCYSPSIIKQTTQYIDSNLK